MKAGNNTIVKIATTLIVAAIIGVFGFASNLDRRIDRHDVEFAKMGKDIDYIKQGVETLLNK